MTLKRQTIAPTITFVDINICKITYLIFTVDNYIPVRESFHITCMSSMKNENVYQF